MAGQRSLITRVLLMNGIQLIKEVDSHTPPNVKKTMQETRGGSFIPGEIMVGLEKMNSKFTVKGASPEFLSAYGATAGDLVQVDIKESLQDEDGIKYAMHYSQSGEIISVTDSDSKMGDLPSHDIEMSIIAYEKTENGKTIYNIDRNAQILDLGQGDLMAEHRRNIGM
jgi:hypothetical protein